MHFLLFRWDFRGKTFVKNDAIVVKYAQKKKKKKKKTCGTTPMGSPWSLQF